MTSHELKVCPRCGWHDGFNHKTECDPDAGHLADQFAAKFPNVRSTKLGYGTGRLTFLFERTGRSVTFNVTPRGMSVAHFFWTDGNMLDFEKLVAALAGTVGGK